MLKSTTFEASSEPEDCKIVSPITRQMVPLSQTVLMLLSKLFSSGHDWNELANDAAIAMDFPELQTTGSNSEVRRLLLSILSLKNTF